MSQKPVPYTIGVAAAVLKDVRRRLNMTRWPDDPGNDDRGYGVNLGYLKSLVDYWRNEYD